MDTKILLKLLEDQANPTKVPAMEAYMKNKFSFLGVQKPILKKIERDFFKPFIKDPIDWLLWKSVGSNTTVSFNILLWIIWIKRRRSLDLKIFQS